MLKPQVHHLSGDVVVPLQNLTLGIRFRTHPRHPVGHDVVVAAAHPPSPFTRHVQIYIPTGGGRYAFTASRWI